MPYIPEFQLTLGTGVHFNKWGVDATMYYVDEMFTTGANDTQTDNYVTFDLSAYYDINENLTLLGGVNNVFNEVYEASHHPNDIRPGAPQTFYFGLEYTF